MLEMNVSPTLSTAGICGELSLVLVLEIQIANLVGRGEAGRA